MEGIIFTGIQASGKSTFYKNNFFNSHVRISLDLLNTRKKEKKMLDQCLSMQQKIVVDNTNPTIEERQRYFELFKAKKYKVTGYYFKAVVNECLERNQKRKGKARIPKVGIFSTVKKLQIPTKEEGYDSLYTVEIVEGKFEVTKVF